MFLQTCFSFNFQLVFIFVLLPMHELATKFFVDQKCIFYFILLSELHILCRSERCGQTLALSEMSSVLKATIIDNKTTSVTTHFEKLTT